MTIDFDVFTFLILQWDHAHKIISSQQVEILHLDHIVIRLQATYK